jgi:hypothetical protein
VVLYHGRRPWPYSTRFLDWLAMPEGSKEELAPLQPDYGHLLMDLSQVRMEAISGCLVTRLALTLMKAVQEGRVLEWMEQFGKFLLELRQQAGMMGRFRAMLRYLFQAEASAPSTFRELAARVSDIRTKEEVMTIEQQIRLEGQQEGWKQGSVVGQIQTCQELLDLPLTNVEELARKSHSELESLLRELKNVLRSRVRR